MKAIVVYAPFDNARLSFVLNWLFKERLQLNFIITNKVEDHSISLSYGKIIPGVPSVFCSGLLGETGIKPIQLPTGAWRQLPTLFPADKDGYTVSFDLFSAIFYLLSRYEEYLPHQKDKHSRYPPEESILYKNGWLQRPLVDEWVSEFRLMLEEALNTGLPKPKYKYLPTYDIDIAYSHIFKGIARIAGAYLKALMRGDISQINERTQVLKKKKQDPYDSFSWLRKQHTEYGYKPVYFILCAQKTSAFDKNISPYHPAMIRVMKQLAKDGATGIHPSYYATAPNIISREKSILQEATGREVTFSRQHYIKVSLPATYRLLLQNNITDDFTMGYGSQLGFRAGTGSSFLWYDLTNECTTALLLHPFCFMDTTAHYELGLSAHEAFEQLNDMNDILLKTGSTMTTVFHNFSLGTAPEWAGWAPAYQSWLQQLSGMKKAVMHDNR